MYDKLVADPRRGQVFIAGIGFVGAWYVEPFWYVLAAATILVAALLWRRIPPIGQPITSVKGPRPR